MTISRAPVAVPLEEDDQTFMVEGALFSFGTSVDGQEYCRADSHVLA